MFSTAMHHKKGLDKGKLNEKPNQIDMSNSPLDLSERWQPVHPYHQWPANLHHDWIRHRKWCQLKIQTQQYCIISQESILHGIAQKCCFLPSVISSSSVPLTWEKHHWISPLAVKEVNKTVVSDKLRLNTYFKTEVNQCYLDISVNTEAVLHQW